MVTIRGKIEVKIEVKIEEIIEMKYFKKGKRRVFLILNMLFLYLNFICSFYFNKIFRPKKILNAFNISLLTAEDIWFKCDLYQ